MRWWEEDAGKDRGTVETHMRVHLLSWYFICIRAYIFVREMWMQSYSSLPVSNSRRWWYDTSFLCINLPSYFRWVSMCAPPHLEWIEADQTPRWNGTSGAVLFPGFRACAGIQVPIIFTSNVNQRTRTRQSPLLPFGMEMGCIHRSAAILAADEMGWLGLIKISPQIQAL